MSRLFFTPLAEADLDDMLSYIEQHRPLTARQVVGRIRQKCAVIAAGPEVGQRRREFPGHYRSFPVQRWVIFYRIVGCLTRILPIRVCIRSSF